ncbi:MAG UNVERIFIED_CONTAM: pentapeptide repeat-containing protein [Microcystis novacekii LVE1205-3]
MLRQASLLGTNLQQADLSSADLRLANLQNTILTDIIYNAQTQWPDGFRFLR